MRNWLNYMNLSEIKAVGAGWPPELVAEAKARGREADPWQVAAELEEQFRVLSAGLK